MPLTCGEGGSTTSEVFEAVNNAELQGWIAEAEAMTANSYATEAEDVVVKVYTSDGDGTFTATDQTGVYSSLHYQQNANPSFRGALVNISSNYAISNNFPTRVEFDSESYDTDSIHSTTVNNNRLTVPLGVTRVKLVAQAMFDTNGTGFRYLHIIKNGSGVTRVGLPLMRLDASATTDTDMQLSSAVVSVTSGDYFELEVFQNSGSDLNIEAAMWFSMEIIE